MRMTSSTTRNSHLQPLALSFQRVIQRDLFKYLHRIRLHALVPFPVQNGRRFQALGPRRYLHQRLKPPLLRSRRCPPDHPCRMYLLTCQINCATMSIHSTAPSMHNQCPSLRARPRFTMMSTMGPRYQASISWDHLRFLLCTAILLRTMVRVHTRRLVTLHRILHLRQSPASHRPSLTIPCLLRHPCSILHNGTPNLLARAS